MSYLLRFVLLVYFFSVSLASASMSEDNFYEQLKKSPGYLDSFGGDTLHVVGDDLVVMTGALNEWTLSMYLLTNLDGQNLTFADFYEGDLDQVPRRVRGSSGYNVDSFITISPLDTPFYKRKYYIIMRNLKLAAAIRTMEQNKKYSFFAYIRDANYFYGFEKLNYVDRIPRLQGSIVEYAPENLGTVKASSLNIRKLDQPSVVVDQVKRDRDVPIYGSFADWYLIGENRVVAKKYIQQFPASMLWQEIYSEMLDQFLEVEKDQSKNFEEFLNKTVKFENNKVQNSLELQNALSSSDDFDRYAEKFIKVSKKLIEEGICLLNDFKENGGWWKSTTKDGNVYFTYCGEAIIQNRIYFDVDREEYFK